MPTRENLYRQRTRKTGSFRKGADAQSEERVPIRLQERELAPVLFQQSTDVADWLLEADSNRFPAACTTFAGSARRLTGAPFSNRNRQWSFRSGSSPA